jgi:hypothetical protein
LSIALTIGNQSLQSSATYKFFSTLPTLFSLPPLTGSQRHPLPISHQRHPPPLSHQPHPRHPSATNAGDSMTKKPDEGDPYDMETIVSLFKGLQTSLAGLKQDVSTVKLDNSRLSVAVNRLQSEQLFDEKNLFKETLDTSGEPNESLDSSQSSSSMTSSSRSRRSEKTCSSDGKRSKRPHRDGKHREEHIHHSHKGIQSTPHVHKLKFPTFAGTEDPLHWIHKCE